MPGLQRFVFENAAYHTTSATRGRRPLLSDPSVATAVLDAINASRGKGHLLLLAYVLMPDHMHLLCVPGDGLTISDVMKSIKGTSAKAINRAGLMDGPVWQRSFYDRVVRTEDQMSTTVEYIHRNPVVMGLVKAAEDYRFSSAHASASIDVDRFFQE